MESGSLLPEALERMRQLREYEFGFGDGGDGGGWDDGGEDGILGSGDVDADGVGEAGIASPTDLPRNALVVSLYLLDDDLLNGDDDDGDCAPTADDDDDDKGRRIRHLRRLASVCNVVNSELTPAYRRYAHPWINGGDGPVFGAHCSGPPPSSRVSSGAGAGRGGATPVPHLRAVVKYGHSILDEWAAVALAAKLTADLKSAHGINAAAEVWDADDGHILLIEAAEHLPEWADDVGVAGCRHRCYLARGKVHLIPPRDGELLGSQGGEGQFGKSDALRRLAASMSEGRAATTTTEAPRGVQDAVSERIRPFLEAWSSPPSSAREGVKSRRRRENVRVPEGLREHLHRCALILPLTLARVVERRPELLGAAIMTFCRREGEAKRSSDPKSKPTKPTSSGGGSDRGSAGTCGKECVIPFEHLVFSVLTLSRTSYALLMTGAGLVPSPYRLPREYRGPELRQMKGTCQMEGMRDRLRYSLEGGVRLCRGFELLLRGDGGDGNSSSVKVGGNGAGAGETVADDPQIRLRGWMDLDARSGGDGGSWIERAWTDGPNATDPSRSLDALLACPLYRPDITNGGLCPSSHPGKTPARMARDGLREVEKEGELSSEEVGTRFGVPREEEVDADAWLDVRSPDAFDRLLLASSSSNNRDAGGGECSPADDGENNPAVAASSDDDGASIRAVDGVLSGLRNFVESESGVEGVDVDEIAAAVAVAPRLTENGSGAAEGKEDDAAPSEPEMPWFDRPDGGGGPQIDPKEFFRILHWTLAAGKEGKEGEEGAAPAPPPWLRDNSDESEPKRGATGKKKQPRLGEGDDFFGREDYEPFDDDANGDDGSSECDSDNKNEASAGSSEEGGEPSMADFMTVMDQELRGTNVERGGANVQTGGSNRDHDDTGGDGDGDGDGNGREEEYGDRLPRVGEGEPAALDVAVLTNLLESLDAQGGGPGPASNLLGDISGRGEG